VITGSIVVVNETVLVSGVSAANLTACDAVPAPSDAARSHTL